MIDFHLHAGSCVRCEASAWELVGEYVPHRGRPQDVIECAFCGQRLRVEAAFQPAAPRPSAAPLDTFRFKFGRFQGMTFAEADAEQNGRAYLEHLRDTNEKLRDRIAEYLAGAT